MRLRQIVHLEVRLRQLQRPGQMVNIDPRNVAALRRCEQRVAFGQEALQSAFDARFAQAAVVRAQTCPRPAQHPLAPVMEGAILVRVHLHSRPVIGQVKKHPRYRHRERIRRIQREKINTCLIGVPLANVGSEIQFREAIRPGHRWEPAHFDPVHPEGNHANPCRAVEGVHGQRFGQQMRQLGSR